jgi:zinc-binding alcohol dehydrogenase family protein
MKATGYAENLPLSDAKSLEDIDLPRPIAAGHDLLVKVHAISVNPADYKVRQGMAPEAGEYKVIGWDATGEVVATGEEVKNFTPGDVVYYAGDITRPGCNAEYQLVDERIVGKKPKSLSDAEAAALPLTAITAWEILFEHLLLRQQAPGSSEKSDEILLVVGAAGGVGSILIQLARALTGATIIATASRPSSEEWVRNLGADYVINHRQPLGPQIEALEIGSVTHVASLHSTDSYYDTYCNILAPFGKIAMTDDPPALDVTKLKLRSLSFHWEFMFARSMFQAGDMDEQGKLLDRVADLIDRGYVKTTIGKNMGTINAANLKAAHAELESGKSIGKIVLEGF